MRIRRSADLHEKAGVSEMSHTHAPTPNHVHPTAWQAQSSAVWRSREDPLAELLAQPDRVLDACICSSVHVEVVDVADELGQVGAVVVAPTPRTSPGTCAFFMSMRVWKNVVTGRHRIAAGYAAR